MEEAGIETTTISRFLENYRGERYEIELPEGSWGMYGTHYTWWNPEVEWMWEHIHLAERRMVALASKYLHEDEFGDRVFEQLGRELLLIESSDWPFLITTGQAKEYGKKRLLEHANYFHRLANALEEYFKSGKFKEKEFLEDIEEIDNPFHPINIEVYVSEEPPNVPDYIEPPEIPLEEEEKGESISVASAQNLEERWESSKAKRQLELEEITKEEKEFEKKLLAIKGIGPKTVEKLKKAGIRSIEDLKNADLVKLAKETRIPKKRLEIALKYLG